MRQIPDRNDSSRTLQCRKYENFMLWNSNSAWRQNCGREEQSGLSNSYCSLSKKSSKLKIGEIQEAARDLPQMDY